MNRATDTKYFVRWEPCGKEGTIPENAVPGGTYTNGETLYIGRQRVKQNKNEFIPGYILPSKMELTVSYGTGTKVLHEFEIMVSDYPSHLKWRKKSDIDQNPIRPVTGGCDAGFYEAYFIGRTHTSLAEGKTWRGRRISEATLLSKPSEEQSVLPGKIHLGHGCLYVGFEAKEYYFKNYEILTMNASPRSLLDQSLLKVKSQMNDDDSIKCLGGRIPASLISRLENILPW